MAWNCLEATYADQTLLIAISIGWTCSKLIVMGVLFNGAVLEGANMKSACFRNADFSGARITADRLGRASSLAHANLTDAKLDDALLEGTEYDANTIFPTGFDPVKHGMVLVPIVDNWLISPECDLD